MTQSKPKVVFVCNSDGALFVFRGPILSHLIASGFDVSSISGKSIYLDKLLDMGVVATAIDFDRHSVSLIGGIKLTREIYRVIKAEQPDMNRYVAIKILHSRYLSRSDLVSRFRRVVRAMSPLSPPNPAAGLLFCLLGGGARTCSSAQLVG